MSDVNSELENYAELINQATSDSVALMMPFDSPSIQIEIVLDYGPVNRSLVKDTSNIIDIRRLDLLSLILLYDLLICNNNVSLMYPIKQNLIMYGADVIAGAAVCLYSKESDRSIFEMVHGVDVTK